MMQIIHQLVLSANLSVAGLQGREHFGNIGEILVLDPLKRVDRCLAGPRRGLHFAQEDSCTDTVSIATMGLL